ncbi:MAG: hypothetical protein IPG97_07505 [Microthrixaceae bacterium]|nr:hypothetical protein [Microthrixaceae bacterium]
MSCWGKNNYGQLGNGTTTNTHTPVPVAGINNSIGSISSAHLHTCAVLTDAIARWGAKSSGHLSGGTNSGAIFPFEVLSPEPSPRSLRCQETVTVMVSPDLSSVKVYVPGASMLKVSVTGPRMTKAPPLPSKFTK